MFRPNAAEGSISFEREMADFKDSCDPSRLLLMRNDSLSVLTSNNWQRRGVNPIADLK